MSRQTFILGTKEFVFGHDHATGWFFQLYIDDECIYNKCEAFDNITLDYIKTRARVYEIDITNDMVNKHLKETPRERYLSYRNPWFDYLKK